MAALAVACAGAAHAQPPNGSLQNDFLAPLRQVSCPPGVQAATPDVIDLRVKRVPLQGLNPDRKALGELTFVDGFNLTSSDKRLGGLSGIDVLEDGNLLAVSDNGDLVWIDLAEDGLTPKAARIAAMRGATGKDLHGKAEGDAEGLAYADGVALVSFEGDHRVLAFDVGACGAAARGAPITFGEFGGSLAQAFDRAGITVGGNSGPEALAVTPDWRLFTGLETQTDGASPLSARAIEAEAVFDLATGKGMPPVVGMDIVGDGDDVRLFSLHRSTNAMASNVISIVETVFARELDQGRLPARIVSEINERSHVRFRQTSSRVLAQMNLFVTIDNFEGIAARETPDGRVRLYVISDDNFSAKQRTLLMIYDVAKRG
jgi:hypothetical protein